MTVVSFQTSLKTVPKELMSLSFWKVEPACARNILLNQQNHSGSGPAVVNLGLLFGSRFGIDS